jgi:hypothetical protein
VPAGPVTLLPGQSKPLPRSYFVLLGRDIFTKAHARPYDPNGGDGGYHPVPPPKGPDNPTTREGPPPESPTIIYLEASLVLRAIAGDTNHFEGFVEDRAAKTAFVKAGDPIAGGRVKQVTFDHLDYEHGSHVTRVEIGQNLLGQAAAAIVAAPEPAPVASETGPRETDTGETGSRETRGRGRGGEAPADVTAAAPAAPSPPASSGGNTDDIAARLRARRAAEGGGR